MFNLVRKVVRNFRVGNTELEFGWIRMVTCAIGPELARLLSVPGLDVPRHPCGIGSLTLPQCLGVGKAPFYVASNGYGKFGRLLKHAQRSDARRVNMVGY